MSSRARRLGGALLLLALLSLVAAAFASADSGPPLKPDPGKLRKAPGTANPAPAPIAAPIVGYRLTAKLSPVSGTSSASGRWDGFLVHIVGPVHPGQIASSPGCSVASPKQSAPGRPTPTRPDLIKCKVGSVPPFTVPGSGNRWVLGWRLTYSNLSSSVSGAQIHVSAPTSAPVAAASLCSQCTSGKFGHTTLTEAQANAILAGDATVVVGTANNPGGEISGPIVKVTTKGPWAGH